MLPVSGRTRTRVAYGYLEGTVNPETLSEFQRRLTRLQEQRDIRNLVY